MFIQTKCFTINTENEKSRGQSKDIGNIGPTKTQGKDKQNKTKIQLRKSNETYVSLSLL